MKNKINEISTMTELLSYKKAIDELIKHYENTSILDGDKCTYSNKCTIYSSVRDLIIKEIEQRVCDLC